MRDSARNSWQTLFQVTLKKCSIFVATLQDTALTRRCKNLEERNVRPRSDPKALALCEAPLLMAKRRLTSESDKAQNTVKTIKTLKPISPRYETDHMASWELQGNHVCELTSRLKARKTVATNGDVIKPSCVANLILKMQTGQCCKPRNKLNSCCFGALRLTMSYYV